DSHEVVGSQGGDADQVSGHLAHIAEPKVLWSRVPSDRVDRTGQVIGQRFRIDALIRHRAMADVYPPRDLETGVDIALKVLKKSLARDPAIQQRFAREADVQAKL